MAGRRRLLAILHVVALAAAALSSACNDVGDSSAMPSGGEDATVVVGDEIAAPLPEAGGQGSEEDAASGASDDGAATSSSDSATTEDGAIPVAPEDGSAYEVDAGGEDAPADVSSPVDSTAPEDAGTVDASTADATIAFEAGADAGGADAGHDGGGADAGGSHDAGSSEGGGALTACATAGQTQCVQCQYNNGAGGTFPNTTQLCTPMEAALVAHDIAAGLATAPGPDPAGSCYQCAALSGCLDDSEFGDKAHECEDLSGAVAEGECEATLACILGSACGATAVSSCYCGSAPVSGSCASVGTSNAANGACKSAEAAGLGLSSDDGLDILKNFTSTTLPSGVANNVLQCAASNNCTACLH